MALTLDGHAAASTTGTPSSQAVALTTALGNDIICAYIGNNTGSSSIVTVASVVGGGLTWTKKNFFSGVNGYGYGQDLELWWALATNPLSAVTITANLSAAATDAQIIAFGVNGANLSTPFDVNASASIHNSNLTLSGSVCSVPGLATTNPDTMLISAWGSGGTGFLLNDPGAGFTFLDGHSAQAYAGAAAEYDIVSAAQSAFTVPWGATTFTNWIALADAIQAASGGAPARTPTLTLMAVG